jgi:UDP-N-acetylglucosamine 2-epimerase (non-hydrolysing)
MVRERVEGGQLKSAGHGAGRRMLICVVAGARPNFMKIAPIIRALDAASNRFAYRIIHTGQHYDAEMNEVFFRELAIPDPAAFLGAGGGSHGEQTAKIMIAFEADCLAHRPDLVLVVGDVNSTLACALVAAKLNIPVAHVEAGLRSGDMAMPEEINRRVTDALSDWLFVTEPAGIANLRREGKDEACVFHVGHVMVDNLFFQCARLDGMDVGSFASNGLKKELDRYGVVTLHRPSNVESGEALGRMAAALGAISNDLPLIFPVHPRTRASLDRFGVEFPPSVSLTAPLSYMEFLNLWRDAALVITDSGGLQEETTALGVPCITVRENTERPVTVEEGTNVLAGTRPENIIAAARDALAKGRREARRPKFWDGRAAERIIAILDENLPAPTNRGH